MQLTVKQLKYIAGGPAPLAAEFAAAFDKYAETFGFNSVARVVEFLAQIAVENRFQYRKEIWGPTAAQVRYEGREDLGNTQPGDGKRFMGRGPLQLTGRANYRAFTQWLRKRIPNCPDFEKNPELLEKLEWGILSAFYYWDTRGLNALADKGNTKAITKKVNGGYNHLAERQAAAKRGYTVITNETLGIETEDDDVAETTIVAPKVTLVADTVSATGAATALLQPAETEEHEVAYVPPSEVVTKLPFWAKWVGMDKAPVVSTKDRPGLKPGGDPALWDVQDALKRLGYEPILRDGLNGDRTRNSVRTARRRNGLPEGEEVDDAFKAALPGLLPAMVSKTRADATTTEMQQQSPDLFAMFQGFKVPGTLGAAATTLGALSDSGLMDKIKSGVDQGTEVMGQVQTTFNTIFSIGSWLYAHWWLPVGLLVAFVAAKIYIGYLKLKAIWKAGRAS